MSAGLAGEARVDVPGSLGKQAARADAEMKCEMDETV
jgi:hypothetical protein